MMRNKGMDFKESPLAAQDTLWGSLDVQKAYSWVGGEWITKSKMIRVDQNN